MRSTYCFVITGFLLATLSCKNGPKKVTENEAKNEINKEAKQDQPLVLTHVLSHNDYEQPRPLLDALDAKINMVEADLALRNDTLFVTHTIEEIQPQNTFEALYINPLRERIEKNGGFVYTKGTPFILYIDLKTKGETINRVNEVLKANSDVFTKFSKDSKTNKPILAISGTPGNIESPERYVVAEFNDLDKNTSYTGNEYYLVNLHWGKYFTWRGEGPFPEEEKQKLLRFVEQAHSKNRLLRFWDNPDITTPHGKPFWDTILGLGVDILSTDAPQAIAVYFQNKK